MKKKIISVLVAACAASLLVVPTLAGNADFSLHPVANNPAVSTEAEKKDDNLVAVVNLKAGLADDHVTFRVRTARGLVATDYQDIYSYGKSYYSYLSGHGYVGNYYKLYSSYDADQWRSGAYVSGTWAP